jgi:hypothetical protein
LEWSETEISCHRARERLEFRSLTWLVFKRWSPAICHLIIQQKIATHLDKNFHFQIEYAEKPELQHLPVYKLSQRITSGAKVVARDRNLATERCDLDSNSGPAV